jgi:galactokinase
VEILKKHYPNVASLRDATSDMLQAHKSEMDEVVYRRCFYVVAENQRVIEACNALSADDLATFGKAMLGSHYGLRDDYEVSCPELDVLQSAAEKLPGVLGSRMMGGGFGGCTINLIEENALENFQAVLGETFVTKLGKEPIIHVCQLKGGTELL